MSPVEIWVKQQWITRQIAYSLIRREKETDPLKVANRKNACNNCPFNKKKMCTICDCIIEVKVSSKTHLNIKTKEVEITHCPKARWPGEEEVTRLYQPIH